MVFANLPLCTARLALRLHREADADAVFGIFADPRVMRYWSGPAWTDLEQAHEAVARHVAAFAAGEYLTLGIERREDGRLIGQCTLFNLSAQSRRAEIGYCLASDAWGHGYMQEALGGLIGYAFEVLDLNRLEADIDPRNLASARTLERLGFEKEGVLRERWIVGGEVSDSALYGLLARDWRAAP